MAVLPPPRAPFVYWRTERAAKEQGALGKGAREGRIKKGVIQGATKAAVVAVVAAVQ